MAISIAKRGWLVTATYRVVPVLLGRWLLGMRQKRFIYRDILESPALRSEVRIGWVAHYGIGTLLGIAYTAWFEPWMARTSLGSGSGLLFGLLTCVLPWCFLYPVLGFGLFASRTQCRPKLLLSSTVNHLVYGLGLMFVGLALRAFQRLEF